MPIVTLTTDFGTADGFVAAMKGIMLSICPTATLVDATHAIPAQNIVLTQLALARFVPYYPPETIHLVVVDPGVGSGRAALAAMLGDQYFIGPDNGIFTPFLSAKARKIVRIDNPLYLRTPLSATFHGRDLFAPAAAHLAAGIALEELGPALDHPVHMPLPTAEKQEDGWRGTIIAADHFGNLLSNVSFRDYEALAAHHAHIHMAGGISLPIVRCYAEAPTATPVVLLESSGHAEIAIAGGSAAAWWTDTFQCDPIGAELLFTT